MAGDRFIRMPEVVNLVGIKRSSICNYVKRGDFPQPLRPGGAG
jgi:predicted DNA-binding transcriptional regulator AlpA